MNIWYMICGLLFMLLLYFSIHHLIVNRGKIEMKYMFICTKIPEIYLLFKKKNVIVKMTRDFNEKLGKPNMEKYGEELVKGIQEKIKEEGEIK